MSRAGTYNSQGKAELGYIVRIGLSELISSRPRSPSTCVPGAYIGDLRGLFSMLLSSRIGPRLSHLAAQHFIANDETGRRVDGARVPLVGGRVRRHDDAAAGAPG